MSSKGNKLGRKRKLLTDQERLEKRRLDQRNYLKRRKEKEREEEEKEREREYRFCIYRDKEP